MSFLTARLICNDLTPVSNNDLTLSTTNANPEGRKVAALEEQLSPDSVDPVFPQLQVELGSTGEKYEL